MDAANVVGAVGVAVIRVSHRTKNKDYCILPLFKIFLVGLSDQKNFKHELANANLNCIYAYLVKIGSRKTREESDDE